MSNYQSLYWLTRIDTLSSVILGIGIILFILVAVIYFFVAMNADFDQFKTPDEIAERKKRRTAYLNKTKWMIPLGVVLLLVHAFIPSRNDIIFIVAGGKTIDFIQNDTSINKIPAQTTEIISSFLDKQIKDLEKGEEKSNKK